MNNIIDLVSKIYSDKINKDIVEDYKNFVGKDALEELLKKFNKKNFSIEKKWNQVMGSRSTEILGSGFASTSITAEYSKLDKDTISVLNRALNDSFKDIYIKGTSKPRDPSVPTCRTVSFGSTGIEGDYWIIHINDKLDTFIVVAPLILPKTSIKILPGLACYVLTSKTHNKFWGDDRNVKEILDVTKKYGFDNFFNKPLATPETLEQGPGDMNW
jgi:hypothetical protein